MDPAARFRSLHDEGTFVVPNPWDLGSARILVELGYPALATTSSGLGRAIGKNDQEVTRDELVAHVGALAAAVDVPVHVDGECRYPDDPGGITTTVRMLADAGAAGTSIEDHVPGRGVLPLAEAVDAVTAAVEACAERDLVLTARAENHLYGTGDLADTIERLLAFQSAGAEVLYAPGLVTAADITQVLDAVQRPLNVLLLDWLSPDAPGPAELASLGVRRISTGGGLQSLAYATMRERAAGIRDALAR